MNPDIKSQPPFMAAVQLMTSCTSTLFLAVYCALHLNINPSRRWWKCFVRKFGWVITAMIAPEVVIWTAIKQWEVARRVCIEGKKIGVNRDVSTPYSIPS
jgi:hypothetical protein